MAYSNGVTDGVKDAAKQYGKQVEHWLDSLKREDAFGMEIHLQDAMLSDCRL